MSSRRCYRLFSPSSPSSPSSPRLLTVLFLTVAILGSPLAPAAAQPTRSLVVVGDSIVLSAAEEIPAMLDASWTVQIDAEVSRPTNVGLKILQANLASLTDTLVIGLGANDSSSPDLFRRRVEAVLAAVAEVPRVFWFEIAEVRNYYPEANAIIRDVASRYDNVEVLPWSAQALADPSLTADDGLHLTAAGQSALARVAVDAVTATAPPENGAGVVELRPNGASGATDPTAGTEETNSAPPSVAFTFPAPAPAPFSISGDSFDLSAIPAFAAFAAVLERLVAAVSVRWLWLGASN